MDLKKKVGELISINSERPGIIHIFEGEKITIGRDQENTNRIDDNRIAQFHCSIFFQDGQVVLKNLCTQGTFLNKEKMGLDLEVNLEHGDHIHLLCQKGKIVTEKHVIAYMFFKYEIKKQSASKSSKRHQPLLEQIRDDLICTICQDLYYEGVAVTPCGHVFCGYCLQGWENENNTCPLCRVQMRNITKAFQINKIIHHLIELNPDIEMKEKPANKYYLQAENDQQSDSSSDSDNDIELLQQVLQLLRLQNNNHFAQLQILSNSLQQMRQDQQINNIQPGPQLLQIQQVLQNQSGVDQPQIIQQNAQQNLQQNSQQNQRQDVQQNQQNGQAQNAQSNQQRANNQANRQPPRQ